MTVMEIAKKLILKTIFEGEDAGSRDNKFDRELDLLNQISVNLGREWGRDSVMSGSIGQDKRHKILFDMPLWSGGIIIVDIKKGTWHVHS